MSKRTPGLLTTPITAATFRDGQWMNEVLLYLRLFAPLNSTRRATAALQTVWKAHQSSAVVVAASTWTSIPLTVDIDPAGQGVSVNGGYLIPATGIYQVSATGAFPLSATGNRRIVAASLDSVTSGNTDCRSDEPPPLAAALTLATPTVLLFANAGQEMTLNLWHDATVPLTTPTGIAQRPSLTVWRWA